MFKVFLVEDEIVVREGIRNNISWEQYGFHYSGDAPDGELALPLIRQIQPDLLITDIRMPFMDGLALIELVRKEFPKTKVVIISGYDDFSYAQQAIHLGVEQYLLKPISKSKLVEILIALQKKMETEQKQQEYLVELSYRYLSSGENILSKTTIRDFLKKSGSDIDSSEKEVDQEHIHSFLTSGVRDDIGRFIDKLLQRADRETVSIPLFCRYLTMTVYLAAVNFLDMIGCRTDSFLSLELRPNDSVSTPEEARQYIQHVIGQVIELRDHESKKQQHNLLAQALRFIDEHFSEESISLERVAKTVNVSPNYFSAVFSQEVGQTFVEYLTGKRIDEAKRMLRNMNMRSSEIANAVGYKDPHYFSFVFKKATGCTPNEFRKGDRA